MNSMVLQSIQTVPDFHDLNMDLVPTDFRLQQLSIQVLMYLCKKMFLLISVLLQLSESKYKQCEILILWVGAIKKDHFSAHKPNFTFSFLITAHMRIINKYTIRAQTVRHHYKPTQ